MQFRGRSLLLHTRSDYISPAPIQNANLLGFSLNSLIRNREVIHSTLSSRTKNKLRLWSQTTGQGIGDDCGSSRCSESSGCALLNTIKDRILVLLNRSRVSYDESKRAYTIMKQAWVLTTSLVFLAGIFNLGQAFQSQAGRTQQQAPKQMPSLSADTAAGGMRARTPAAIAADEAFWRTLHEGDYDGIAGRLIQLKGAYLQDSADSTTAAHIAFLHTWRIAERARQSKILPNITDDAILANRYFQLANARSSLYDARFHGFSAVMQMVEADIFHDDELWSAGLKHGRESIANWPEFNWFSIGFALSGKADTSALFREALEMQWKTLDSCERKSVSRTNPTIKAGLGEGLDEPDLLKRRACYNSMIAPHNIEGFFLNMGDMVLRSGDWRTAQRVYALAKDSQTFDSWPYRETLEARIQNAEHDAASFQHDGNRLMLRSPFACTACHQAR